MNEHFEELTIEIADDEKGRFIILRQDNCGNSESVAIHPMHLRYMAEKFGLVETSDPQASKTIAMLKRRMTVLQDRIESLHDFLANHSDHKHADLSFEVSYATATLDIANEFCADLEAQGEAEAIEQSGQQVREAK
jgi:hypothetical protein